MQSGNKKIIKLFLKQFKNNQSETCANTEEVKSSETILCVNQIDKRENKKNHNKLI